MKVSITELMEFLAERIFKPMLQQLEKTMLKEVQDLTTKTNALTAEVAAMHNALTAENAELVDIKGKLDAAIASGAQLQAALDAANANLATANASLTDAQAQLATALANATDQATIDAINGASSQVDAAIAQLKTDEQAAADATAANAATN